MSVLSCMIHYSAKVNALWQRVSQFLLPPLCLLCQQTTAGLLICDFCCQALPYLSPGCLQCGNSMPGIDYGVSHCDHCITKPPAFRATFALFAYQEPIEQFLIQLKFNRDWRLAHLFGTLLLKQIQTTWYKEKAMPDLILPMPLHSQRLAYRGFNQAVEIAKPIAKGCKIPLARFLVKRHKPTLPQTGLTARERGKNLRNAFSLQHSVAGKTIAILDDVVTTGTTVREISKLLRKNGAKAIDIWCCARRVSS